MIQTIIASIQALHLGRLIQSYIRFLLISPSKFRSSEVSKRCYNHWFIAIFKRILPCNFRPLLLYQALIQNISIADAYSSELLLWFLLQHHVNLNFQKKGKTIGPFRDWNLFSRNYGLAFFHHYYYQKSYTWGTRFDWKIASSVPAIKTLIVLLILKLLMVLTHLGIIARICLSAGWTSFIALGSPSKVPRMPQTMRLDKLSSDVCIKIPLNQIFKNYFKFRLLSAIKLNLKLNFRLDFIHHAAQPKTWACIRWFDWENFPLERRFRFLVVRKCLGKFHYQFIWRIFIIFLRSNRVFSLQQKLNRKKEIAADYAFEFSCDPFNEDSRSEKSKNWNLY